MDKANSCFKKTGDVELMFNNKSKPRGREPPRNAASAAMQFVKERGRSDDGAQARKTLFQREEIQNDRI
jgi:hypothetical protein